VAERELPFPTAWLENVASGDGFRELGRLSKPSREEKPGQGIETGLPQLVEIP
jgi:hypothetical protein